MAKVKDIAKTRERLLDAAEIEFGTRGFKNATIRAICRRARANIAAVNYHFSDKDDLYLQVFRRALNKKLFTSISAVTASALPPDKQLTLFIHTFLKSLLSADDPLPHTRLMVREMIEPTPALDVIANEGFRPMIMMLSRIISQLIQLPPDHIHVRHMLGTIMGQMTFYRQSQPVITRLFPNLRYDTATIDQIAEHITLVALAAVDVYKSQTAGQRKKQ